ncbi:MAG: MalY/PatB family protein [Candidatus Cyclobacteriaceae bacterium M3_2C_046]
MQYNFNQIIDRTGTASVKYDYRRAFFGTEDVLPLWVADMDFAAPDFIAKAIQERAQHEVYGYTINTEKYFNAIIEWTTRRYNWPIQASWISHSPGVVPALGLALLTFTKPGDRVILQSPVYPPFFNSIEDNGRVIVNNQLVNYQGHYEIDFDLLQKQMDDRVKVLLLCNPHNPVGRVWTVAELEKIAELCLKNRVLIISDDIHADLVYAPAKYTPIASLSNEVAQQTLTCIAPSKTFNIAGLSTAVTISPNRQLITDFKNKLADLHLNFGNVFGLTALEAAYSQGDEWLEQALAYMQDNISFVDEYLKTHIPSIKMKRPEGTFLLWLDCRDLGLESKELFRFMVKQAKLGFNDGPMFGSGGEGFQRMNIATPRTVLKKAMEQLRQAVDELKL